MSGKEEKRKLVEFLNCDIASRVGTKRFYLYVEHLFRTVFNLFQREKYKCCNGAVVKISFSLKLDYSSPYKWERLNKKHPGPRESKQIHDCHI